jgi:pseudouridine kinase
VSAREGHPAESAPVVLIGSSCFDIRGRVRDCFQPASVNAGRVRIAPGGTARNIAENLARLDMPTRLLTAVGDDEQGRLLVQHARSRGIVVGDDDLIVDPARPSGSFLALLGDDGALIGAIDDTSVMRAITPRDIHHWHRAIRDAALVVADATLRPQTIATIVRLCHRYGVALCLEPVSPALAPRIAPFLADTTLITPNMAEAGVLTGLRVTNRDEAQYAALALQGRGANTAIITMSGAGVVYVSADSSGHVPAVATEVVDAAGAGDALTAGVIFGLLNDFALDEAVKLGAAMASLTMLVTETVHPELSLERAYAHLEV